MIDPRDLKIALLRAQRERALRYDPEWGPADEDRPLGYLVGAEWRIRHGCTPMGAIAMALAEHVTNTIALSNAMFARINARRKPYTYSGGKSIIVPLTYATHDRDIAKTPPR